MSMQENTLVSVVVPVYNVEKYIARCIESILAQTHENLELILVDDGSPDQSGAICDKYAAKDSRIKVIHIPNGGVSYARNTGLDAAAGEYVVFVDSDDWVTPEYIQGLLPAGSEDLIAGGYVCVSDDTITATIPHTAHTVTQKQWVSDFCYWWYRGALMHPWGHSYHRSVIENHRLRFDPALSIGEDELFNLQFLMHCDMVRYVDACNYCYRSEAEGSLMHRHHPDRTESSIKIVQAMECISQKKEYFLRWREWKSAILHHYKHLTINKGAVQKAIKRQLRDCYRESYFRECLPYIRKNGTLDEKIETYFMRSWLHPLYKPVYSIIVFLSKIKHYILRK